MGDVLSVEERGGFEVGEVVALVEEVEVGFCEGHGCHGRQYGFFFRDHCWCSTGIDCCSWIIVERILGRMMCKRMPTRRGGLPA